ncbi:uncharacterized protein LOC121725387 [Aricia agestis]|uniref:uncharacterized protein LOC121725387 n=1 Tax=Aricia agestis TaxID=91739 RepID=UPI001C2055E5|nr:uncharacterized protein LOC121725387 [Aricia agestis]
MDEEEMALEEKCEHLMNIVVESRKRFGKMCTEYEQKTSLVENKMLNLQIETIANYRFKSKVQLPQQNTEEILKELEQFAEEIQHKQRRMEKLDRDVKNTQNVVLQLKADRIGKKLKAPLTTEEMLASARN